MTVQQLIDILSDLNPDSEVRLMTQQNYPLEAGLFGVTTKNLIDAAGDEDMSAYDAAVTDDFDMEGDGVVYLLEGSQIGYGTRVAWEVARCR